VNLRGPEVTNALLELFAVTRWQQLDFLVLDMPPGFGDAALDIMRFIPRAEVVIVKTPSILSRSVAARAEAALGKAGIKILGTVENYSQNGIRPDINLEAAYGKPRELLKTQFAADVETWLKAKAA